MTVGSFKLSALVAVLFDLEGTLTGTGYRFNISEVRARMREKLIELGVPPRELEGLEDSLTLMVNTAYGYMSRATSPHEFQAFRGRVGELLEEYWERSARESYLMPGAKEALEALKAAGYRLGLVSNASRLDVTIMFEKHRLASYFNTVVSSDEMRLLKPDPDGVLKALRELRETDFIFVGDSVYDLEAARRAGGRAVIVQQSPDERRGWQPTVQLVNGAGAYLVNSLFEVPGVVKQLFPPKEDA
ncbi:MAG: HAD family hydrolase [Candidatus Bathyarchaeia archaeon]